MDFQRHCAEIPEDYCRKDSGEQNFFHCLVCQCPMKSIKSLDAHVLGRKHIRRALGRKREDLVGFRPPPANVARLPEQRKRSRPSGPPSPRDCVKDRLERTDEPVLGLEFITEFVCSDRSKHRIYTCGLDGCKSAWGTAEDICNHLKNRKHHKNYMRHRFPQEASFLPTKVPCHQAKFTIQ